MSEPHIEGVCSRQIVLTALVFETTGSLDDAPDAMRHGNRFACLVYDAADLRDNGPEDARVLCIGSMEKTSGEAIRKSLSEAAVTLTSEDGIRD